jgi:predicted ATPase
MLQSQVAGNLPIQATSFVGRRTEVETIQALIGKRRLVTLVGSGGCGKTRLSLEVAVTQHQRFEDGIWFIDFSLLTSADQVAQLVANVLSIKVDADKTLLESVLSTLKSTRRLLMLDNCEHLIDACAELASAILSHCPDVFLMATSREVLSVRGETMFRIPSLSVPDGEVRNAADVMRTDSGRLFFERAEQQQFHFRIDEENAACIAEICSRLDGIPLAIELAAAQVRTLSVSEIRDSLNDCFDILTSGERSALPRQRTILAAIEWSTNMLDLEQRRLLHRLSVFTGGFTLEAVDAICGDGESQLPILLALADKNLILAKESGKGERRRLLEPVRQFAHKHLAQDGEDQLILRRHRDYFQQMASDARPEKHQDSAGWLKRLTIDRNNLRGAIEWSLEQHDGVEPALRMASDLGWYWYQQGNFWKAVTFFRRAWQSPWIRSPRTRA